VPDEESHLRMGHARPVLKKRGYDMNRKKAVAILCAVSLAASFITQCRRSDGNAVIVKGSTTMAPVIQKAAEMFSANRGVKVEVEGKGSHGGIFALLDGRCDIAESSVRISDREMEIARARGVDVKEYIIAYDLVVPIVHPGNPVKNVSSDMLRRIFSGAVTSWKEAGGKDHPVTIVARDDKSGTGDVWNLMVASSKGVNGVVEKGSNSAVLGEVAHNEGAVGYVSRAFINTEVRGLYVDGIPPTLENGARGTYRIKRSLYLYVDGNTSGRYGRDFVVFLLSREGQNILRENGFIPALRSE